MKKMKPLKSSDEIVKLVNSQTLKTEAELRS